MENPTARPLPPTKPGIDPRVRKRAAALKRNMARRKAAAHLTTNAQAAGEAEQQSDSYAPSSLTSSAIAHE